MKHAILITDGGEVHEDVVLLSLDRVAQHGVCHADRGESLLSAETIRLAQVHQSIGVVLLRETIVGRLEVGRLQLVPVDFEQRIVVQARNA